MRRNEEIERKCSLVLSAIVEKVVKSAELGGVPVHVDKSRSAAAPGMPKWADVVRGFEKKLRPTAPAYQPFPSLNPKAAEFCPIKT